MLAPPIPATKSALTKQSQIPGPCVPLNPFLLHHIAFALTKRRLLATMGIS